MTYRQLPSPSIEIPRDSITKVTNTLAPIKHQRTANRQPHYGNIQKQSETVDSTKIITNIGVGGINSLVRSTSESNDNVNRTTKKSNRVRSMQHFNRIRLEFVNHFSSIMEESLKQIEEYRHKMETNLMEQFSNKLNKNVLKSNHLFKFPQRPKTPIEFIGKSNQNHLSNLIDNTNVDKHQETNSLIGQYEISNSMIPTQDFSSFNGIQRTRYDKSTHSNSNEENLFEPCEEYNLMLTRLLDQYFHGDIYQNLKSKINCLALTEQIKDIFKKLYQRYRIIVQVWIGQHLDQAILISSKSLWDKHHDGFLQKQYSKGTIFALIIIFFIYKE